MSIADPDVAIIGGGAIGCAIAHFLCSDPAFRGDVLVIERDSTYRTASSALSASSIRQQFSAAVNVRISGFGIEFLRDAHRRLETDEGAPAIHLREGGYLFLASDDFAAGRMRARHAMQVENGADVVLLDPREIEETFPGVSSEAIVLGSWGRSGEGWFDGYALLQAFRASARARGAQFVRAQASRFVMESNRVAEIVLDSGAAVRPRIVVNAAGPHARAVAAMAGVHLPVEARPRSVFVLEHRARAERFPLIVDPSGVWFRPEGPRLIAGAPPAAPDDVERFELDVDHSLFESVIWPTLARRAPQLQALKAAGAWAGHYEMNTWDHNALLGLHPQTPNLIFANGFSGHGLQQSPAVGRGIAELIVHGRYCTLDLSELSVARLAEGRRVLEEGVV